MTFSGLHLSLWHIASKIVLHEYLEAINIWQISYNIIKAFSYFNLNEFIEK